MILLWLYVCLVLCLSRKLLMQQCLKRNWFCSLLVVNSVFYLTSRVKSELLQSCHKLPKQECFQLYQSYVEIFSGFCCQGTIKPR